MSVKVFIGRKFQKDYPLDVIYRLINEVRTHAMQQQGYIGGETLVNSDDMREIVVISQWTDVLFWGDWARSEERKRIDDKIIPYLAEPEEFKVFKPASEVITEVFGRSMHEADVGGVRK